MKTKGLFIVTILMIGFLIGGCQKEPTAGFVVSDSDPITGQTVTFSNTTSDGSSYEWDFGDGQTSTATSPTHAYSSGGAKTVTLTAYSKNERKSSKANITVNVIPYGYATFWQDGTPSYGITNVTIGSTVQQITSDYTSVNCGLSGCANFGGIAGVYSYTASEVSGSGTWSGTVTITDGGCATMLLN